MNLSPDRRQCLMAARQSTIRLDEATVVAMGASLCAIFFDRPVRRRERIQAEQDGLPLPRPFIAAELALRCGGARHVLFVPQSIETVLSRRLVLRLDGTEVAEIDPDWLQLPQEGLSALAAQLSVEGARKLLKVMLSTGASLFSGSAQAGLAQALGRLLDICGIAAMTPVAVSQISGRTLVSYAATGVSQMTGPTEAVALLDDRLLRLKGVDHLAEQGELHLLLPPGVAPTQIVAFPGLPLRLAAADGALPRLSVPAWLRDRDSSCREWLLARSGLGTAAGLGRELAGKLTEPTLTVRHLSVMPGGVLHALVLKDPSHVVRQVVLQRGDRRIELTPSHGADGTAMLTGLADLPGEVLSDESCRVGLLNHSGRFRNLSDMPVASYDGGIPAGFEDAWNRGDDVLPSLARARAGFRRPAPVSVTQQFGSNKACCLRIVTAITGSADLIRARAALILAERRDAPVEVVCTMADGPLAIGARHALAEAAATYGIAHRLVLLPDSAHPGEHLRAALQQNQDVPALLLGADVLPDCPGWLAFWLRRLRRRDALAAALLAADGSILAAQDGADPRCGLPAALLPASGRPADRPLVDCLALAPAGLARVLDAGEPHPDPAIWVTAALAGTARTETRFPFRRYGPSGAPARFAAALAGIEFALSREDRR